MKDTQLALPERQLPANPEPSVAQILSAAVQGGVTAENVAVVKELLAMQKEIREDESKRAFARDFVALQAAIPAMEKSKEVKNKDGSHRFAYAPFEEIMDAVKPLAQEHNFGITFDTETVERSITVHCILIHSSGHEKRNKQTVRIGSGPPGSSEAQADGAATSYAKRFALCAALNITIETDREEARGGDAITEEEAAELEKGVTETGIAPVKFLKWLGVVPKDAPEDTTDVWPADYRKIPAARLEEAREQIRKRRK